MSLFRRQDSVDVGLIRLLCFIVVIDNDLLIVWIFIVPSRHVIVPIAIVGLELFNLSIGQIQLLAKGWVAKCAVVLVLPIGLVESLTCCGIDDDFICSLVSIGVERAVQLSRLLCSLFIGQTIVQPGDACIVGGVGGVVGVIQLTVLIVRQIQLLPDNWNGVPRRLIDAIVNAGSFFDATISFNDLLLDFHLREGGCSNAQCCQSSDGL